MLSLPVGSANKVPKYQESNHGAIRFIFRGKFTNSFVSIDLNNNVPPMNGELASQESR